MKNMKLEIKKISIFALFISLGLVLQYIESLFAPIPVPGGKIGLANISYEGIFTITSLSLALSKV